MTSDTHKLQNTSQQKHNVKTQADSQNHYFYTKFYQCKVAIFTMFARLNAIISPEQAPKWHFRQANTYLPKFRWFSINFCIAFIIMLPFYAQWAYSLISPQDISPFLASILGLLSIATILFVPTVARFSVGFFVGALWFYFVGLGLRYFDMSFLIPLIVLGVGLFMGFVFYVGLCCKCLIVRFAFLMLLSYITPFGFDWLVIESVFAYSYFGVDKLSFACIILGLWLFFVYGKFGKIFGIVALILALDFTLFSHQTRFYTPQIYQISLENTESTHFQMTLDNGQDMKIRIIQTHTKQDFIYRMQEIASIYERLIGHIRRAINDGYDIVILPESAFYIPFSIEFSEQYVSELKHLSQEIAIIVGGLREETDFETSTNLEQDISQQARYFNSTYLFYKEQMHFLDKVRLVPFGETLPQWILPIAEYFFQGIGGFSAGESYGYFDIDGVRFKNAICYEGTSRDFYIDKPQLVIVTSNNAWFVPSIEPIVQKNLMKYYARLNGSIILHSSNFSPSFVVTPYILKS